MNVVTQYRGWSDIDPRSRKVFSSCNSNERIMYGVRKSVCSLELMKRGEIDKYELLMPTLH